MDKITKLTLPATIIIASLILGGFFYASQLNKQKSIERQQEIKLQEDRRKEEARAEKEKIDEAFSNNLKCQTLLKDLKKRLDNVAGIYYDELLNTCIVKYIEAGKLLEGAIEDLEQTKNE